jgi:nucleotide-binding universal stress UspA family protein
MGDPAGQGVRVGDVAEGLPAGLVAFGSTSAEIVRIARERNAGLIVMGTHGSRTLHSILFGSTARRVVRDASSPVLAVRRA